MEKFKISDIQEIFVSDVERFHSLTQHHLNQLLSETTPSQDSLDEALRQCHTLKGLAATVEAWGLSCLGTDLEKLLELAGSWMHSERAKANDIFEFILEHMQDWYVMNQFTCMDMLPQAWDIYQGLRAIMDERWPGYLSAPESADGTNAQYVRLTNLELPQVTPMTGTVDAPEPAAQLTESPTPELDVQGAEPVAGRYSELAARHSDQGTGAPLPVRVVPPALRQKKAQTEGQEISAPTPPTAPLPVAIEGRDVKQGEPIASAGDGVSDLGDGTKLETQDPKSESRTSGAPKPVQVVPPALRRRQQAETAEAAPAEAIAPAPPVENLSAVSAPPPPVPQSRDAASAKERLPTAQSELTSLAPNDVQVGSSPAPATEAAATGAPATPPILRVAPPALKRRTPEGSKLQVESGATPSAESDLRNAELGTGNAELGTGSAEAIFAALPEPGETAHDAASSAASENLESSSSQLLTPGSSEQAEWIEMVSQEVAGYLSDLGSNLTALAGNLTDEAQWQQVRRLFHTIKGTAATFKLDAVSTPAKVAELRAAGAYEAVQGGSPGAGAVAREAFEDCVHRAAVVAKALGLPFAEQSVREALELGLAQAQNVAVAGATSTASSVDPEMAGFFINDARDQIQIIERAVLAWEKDENVTEQVWAIQRGFHTIKGAANSIGLTAVAQSVHEVEEHLEKLAAAGAVKSKPLFTFLLGAVDQLRKYLADLARSTASLWRHDWSTALGLLSQASVKTPATGKLEAAAAAVVQTAMVADAAPAISAESEPDSHTLRIEAARLYQLMNLIGEMVIDRARLASKLDQLAGLQRALAERNGALSASVQNFQSEFEFNLKQKSGVRSPESGSPPSALATPHSPEFSELEFDRYDQFNVLARSLVEISHDIEQLNGEVAGCLESFAAENAQFAQTSQELQRRVTGLSLVPVKTLFPRLQRAFRDALAVEQKEADLVLSGGEALLDKVVVDKVYGPLLHLVRNAVAHGIEDVATREKTKKSARGQVRLSATQLANQIVIQLSDDGAGINAVAVRDRAVAKGWVAADAPVLTPEQVVHFIFQPGFSTASKVTSVSGRGVGLDVVRTEVENLNGSVELRYEPGQGSTWSLRLPLTLAISEAILARLGEVTYAFPLNFIEYGVVLDAESLVRAADGSETYVLQAVVAAEPDVVEAAKAQLLDPNSDTSHFARDAVVGASLPVVRLSRLLGVAGAAGSDKGLIVGAGERRAVLVVDEVLARQEVVIKELDAVLAQHPLLNGASLDAQGRVIPILNVPGLLKLAAEAGQKSGVRSEESDVGSQLPASSVSRQTRALVVDDSLSVRKVQERFLRELGCQVVLAKDGLEALERLRHAALDQAASPGSNGSPVGTPFDVVFTDLEMPRMNGFELISEVRGNPAWASVPLVVVSSRGADKYITKAMNLGASTFLSKPFTQEQLGEVLRHFAGLRS